MASTTVTSDTPPSPPIRRPYHGSCHCGNIRYIVFLSLPPAAIGPAVAHTPSVRFVKCNCSTCHKMAFLHIRPTDPPHDFLLLSPQNLSSLSDYQCNARVAHWYFCSNCGVRCFMLVGEGEVADVDLDAALEMESEGKMTKVWRCKGSEVLSINAHTIEPGQEGLDLRELVDKKWIAYVDNKHKKEEARYNYPHEGGTW